MEVPMIESLPLVLTVIGLLGLLITGGNILNVSPLQPAYSSSTEEPAGDGEQPDEPTDDQPVDGPEPTEPEPEPTPESPVAEPMDETIPESPTEEQQEQLTLDIIDANGLVVVNETTTNVEGNVVGGGDDGTPTQKEIKCVKNSQGQTFCYEELKPDEVCLKPINAEDPPLCPPPKP